MNYYFFFLEFYKRVNFTDINETFSVKRYTTDKKSFGKIDSFFSESARRYVSEEIYKNTLKKRKGLRYR